MMLFFKFEVNNKLNYHNQDNSFYNTTIFWNLQIYYF